MEMEIHLTPSQINDVAKKLDVAATRIQEARHSANSQVNTIMNMKSPRLKRDIDAWQKLSKHIGDAVTNLNDIAKELRDLAEKNRIYNA